MIKTWLLHKTSHFIYKTTDIPRMYRFKNWKDPIMLKQKPTYLLKLSLVYHNTLLQWRHVPTFWERKSLTISTDFAILERKKGLNFTYKPSKWESKDFSMVKTKFNNWQLSYEISRENDTVDVLYMTKLLMTVETADQAFVRSTVVTRFWFLSLFTFCFYGTSYF